MAVGSECGQVLFRAGIHPLAYRLRVERHRVQHGLGGKTGVFGQAGGVAAQDFIFGPRLQKILSVLGGFCKFVLPPLGHRAGKQSARFVSGIQCNGFFKTGFRLGPMFGFVVGSRPKNVRVDEIRVGVEGFAKGPQSAGYIALLHINTAVVKSGTGFCRCGFERGVRL